jgi:SAM-dependent methyltransferase
VDVLDLQRVAECNGRAAWRAIGQFGKHGLVRSAVRLLKSALHVLGWPLSIGTTWLPHGSHVTRYTMYRTLSKVLNDPTRGCGKKVLSISHSNNLATHLGIEKAELIEANYPEHSATDLSAFPDGEFDYVISDQVLEHVEGNPQDVFDESLRLLKQGGIAVHTTCFMNPIHGYPSDFWRFTPECLRMLSRKFSEIIEVGGFGNRAIWYIDLIGLRGTPVPHAKWHPLHWIATHNMKAWPVTTWIVARK